MNGLDSFLKKGGAIFIIPILNPDGYERDQRGNSSGKDVNRDFPLPFANFSGKSQAETKMLIDYIDTTLLVDEQRLLLTLDYHCCADSLLMPRAYSNDPIAPAELRKHNVVGALFKSAFPARYRYLSWKKSLGYYATGTSQDFYQEVYGSLSFTFEGQRYIENRNLSRHAALWNSIFQEL